MRISFPRFSRTTYAVLAFSRKHMRARQGAFHKLHPLPTHPCHCHRLLRSAEWTKVGEPLLAAHAINTKASRFYWMDSALPPHPLSRPSSHQPPHPYWLLRREWAAGGLRGVPLYRPGQLYYCSFINFRFSLVMLPRHWLSFLLLLPPPLTNRPETSMSSNNREHSSSQNICSSERDQSFRKSAIAAFSFNEIVTIRDWPMSIVKTNRWFVARSFPFFPPTNFTSEPWWNFIFNYNSALS